MIGIKLPDGWTEDYVRQELVAIEAIYRRLFPHSTIDLHLHETTAPFWGAPEVKRGDLGEPVEDGLILYQRLLGADPIVGIRVGVPPPPEKVQVHSEQGWTPDWIAKVLFHLHPLLHDVYLYGYEMHQKARAFRRHVTLPVPRAVPESFPRQKSRKRPAILIGMHWLEVGGAEKLAFDCVRWALDAGLRVFVVASVAAAQRLQVHLPKHHDLLFLRLDRYLPHALWPEFVDQLVAVEAIRLVHIHHCHPLYDCLPLLRSRHADLLVIDSTHIVEHADGGYPRISGVWTQHIDLHHVISNDLVRFFQNRFQVRDKIKLGRMLHRQSLPVQLPPPNLQPGARQIRICFIGRLSYQKRPILLIECFAALKRWGRRRGIEVKSTILGEGPFRELIEELARKRGLLASLRFLPSDAGVPSVLAESDFLILPSANEGLALVLYEAALNGCLPVATDVGAQAELLPPALLVPAAPLATLRGICRVLESMLIKPDALRSAHDALQENWACILSDSTAEECLMPLYRQTARDK